MLTTRDILWAWVQAQLNIPYVWGGDDPSGYDCSGIAQEFYKIVGIDPPGDQTAADYFRMFTVPTNGRIVRGEPPRFGDMAFYGLAQVTHIGVCMNSLILFEEGGGGSDNRLPSDAAKNNAFARFRPIHARADLRAIVRVTALAAMLGEAP